MAAHALPTKLKKGQTAPSLVLLSFATGATDAFAFTALNGVFTANMTGNLVLVSLFARPRFPASFAGAAIAVAIFALALYAGFRLSRPADGRSRVTALLGAASGFQCGCAVIWVVVSPHASDLLKDVIVAVSAAAMALQTVAAKRAGDDRSISTTFLTGTLTGLMQDLADGVAGERLVRLLIILALPAGALAGAGVMAVRPEFGGVVPALVLLVCVSLEAIRGR